MASETLSPIVPQEKKRTFRSPMRSLVRFFRASRDRWREKCKQRNVEIKRLKNRVNDQKRSRENWKQRAKRAESEMALLQSQLLETQQEVEKKTP